MAAAGRHGGRWVGEGGGWKSSSICGCVGNSHQLLEESFFKDLKLFKYHLLLN